MLAFPPIGFLAFVEQFYLSDSLQFRSEFAFSGFGIPSNQCERGLQSQRERVSCLPCDPTTMPSIAEHLCR